MESKIAERRAHYESETGKLAVRRWRLQQQIEDIDEQLRLLSGAAQEAELSQKDIDTLQAIVQAQTQASQGTEAPPKVVDVPAKKKKKGLEK